MSPHPGALLIASEAAAAIAAAGRPRPLLDGRLGGVASDLARLGETGSLEMRRFLLMHHAVIEPDVTFQLFRFSPRSDDELARAVVATLSGLLAQHSLAALGVGLHRAADEVFVSLVTVERAMALHSVAKQLPARGGAELRGQIPRGFRDAQVVVQTPGGRLGQIPISRSANGVFRSEFRCVDGPGPYQVEVMAEGEGGPTVMANFALYCGRAPPPSFSLSGEPAIVRSTDPAVLEAGLLTLVNQARAGARLRPLHADPRLLDIARRHSHAMAAEKKVAHQMARTGNAGDRVRAVGLRPVLVLENVGSQSALVSSGTGGAAPTPESDPDVAPSALELHQGFMASPGHRANILHRDPTHVAIAVARGTDPYGVPTWYVTQLFAAF